MRLPVSPTFHFFAFVVTLRFSQAIFFFFFTATTRPLRNLDALGCQKRLSEERESSADDGDDNDDAEKRNERTTVSSKRLLTLLAFPCPSFLSAEVKGLNEREGGEWNTCFFGVKPYYAKILLC